MSLSNKFKPGEEVLFLHPPRFKEKPHPGLSSHHPGWDEMVWIVTDDTNKGDGNVYAHPGEHILVRAKMDPGGMSYYVRVEDVVDATPLNNDDMARVLESIKDSASRATRDAITGDA